MLRSNGAVLARNTIYNFLTQIVVSVLAFLSIPVIVRGMGEEVFALLTLIWMVVGYFSILDLGVGQASVKFLAEEIARGEVDRANSTVWVSVAVSAGLGVITSGIMLAVMPLLLGGVIAVPAHLQADMHRSFLLVTVAVPFVMIQGAFRAVPMAVQRFDLFNLLQGLSGLLQWGGSLVLVISGSGLFAIVALTVAIRVVGAAAACVIAVKLFPGLSFAAPKDVGPTVRKLLTFGGWLTVSQAVSPVARYLDRVFVVSYTSLKMFTYYAAPFEAMSRVQVIPLSLSTTLFPAMSERESIHGPAESFSLYMRAMNFTILVMLPIAIGLVAFSQPILHLWLGGSFPELSDGVFKILAAAAFVQAICYLPLTSLQALGRPDLAAKYYLFEIPLYVGLCFLLVPLFGIVGAAWAYCIRMILSTAWFVWIAHRTLGSPPVVFASFRRSLGLNAILLVCLMLVAHVVTPVVLQLAIACATLAAYAAGVWLFCLDRTEQQVIHGLILFRSREVTRVS